MFWPTLPWTRDGQKLWFYIRQFNPHILSAVTPFDKNCIKGKQLWIKRNLKLNDASRIHLVRRTEKRVYANGNVLIDDYGKNVKEWKQNKGMPIKYSSANQTIAALKKIGYK
jgi:transposase